MNDNKKMIFIFSLIFTAFIFTGGGVNAQDSPRFIPEDKVTAPLPPVELTPETVRTRFLDYKQIRPTNIKVPTVVEVPLMSDDVSYPIFAVVDVAENTLEPYYYTTRSSQTPTPFTMSSSISPVGLNIENAYDGDPNSYTEFEIVPGTDNEVTLFFWFDCMVLKLKSFTRKI